MALHDFDNPVDFSARFNWDPSLVQISVVRGRGDDRKTLVRVAWPVVPRVGDRFNLNLEGEWAVRAVVWGVDEHGRPLVVVEIE